MSRVNPANQTNQAKKGLYPLSNGELSRLHSWKAAQAAQNTSVNDVQMAQTIPDLDFYTDNDTTVLHLVEVKQEVFTPAPLSPQLDDEPSFDYDAHFGVDSELPSMSQRLNASVTPRVAVNSSNPRELYILELLAELRDAENELDSAYIKMKNVLRSVSDVLEFN